MIGKDEEEGLRKKGEYKGKIQGLRQGQGQAHEEYQSRVFRNHEGCENLRQVAKKRERIQECF